LQKEVYISFEEKTVIKFLSSASLHEKNDFAEVSKNLVRYSSENNVVGFYQNYVGHS